MAEALAKLNRAKGVWQLAGKYVFRGLKRAFLDPKIRASIGEGIAMDPSRLVRLIPATQWAGARNVAGVFDHLQRLKVRFIVRTYTSTPDEVLRFRIDVVSPKVAKSFIDGQIENLPTWRAPRVSAALERATGIEWRFGEGTMEPEELKAVMGAARHAYRIPEVQKAVAAAMPKKSPFTVKAHVPFKMPDLRFGVSFRQGRAQGFAHVANEVTNLLAVVSFAQFLKGRNPGFVAQVLWANPLVALPMGLAINSVVSHFQRKKAKRRQAAFDRAQDEAAQKAREDFDRAELERERLEGEIEYKVKRYHQVKRAVRMRASMGAIYVAQARAGRYSSMR